LDIIADLINGASADDRLRWEKLICLFDLFCRAGGRISDGG